MRNLKRKSKSVLYKRLISLYIKRLSRRRSAGAVFCCITRLCFFAVGGMILPFENNSERGDSMKNMIIAQRCRRFSDPSCEGAASTAGKNYGSAGKTRNFYLHWLTRCVTIANAVWRFSREVCLNGKMWILFKRYVVRTPHQHNTFAGEQTCEEKLEAECQES